jgi:CRP-like cAMP-binding protein
MAQTAACNRYHSIDQLLCRRLLMSLDRAPNGDIVMTQELASSLLGVRREGVTAAAGRLQKAGVISYSRGRIAVLDRARLEQLTCEFHPGATKEPTLPLSTPLMAVL